MIEALAMFGWWFWLRIWRHETLLWVSLVFGVAGWWWPHSLLGPCAGVFYGWTLCRLSDRISRERQQEEERRKLGTAFLIQKSSNSR